MIKPFDSLPDELIILLGLSVASYGSLVDFVKFRGVSKRMRKLLSDEAVIRNVIEERKGEFIWYEINEHTEFTIRSFEEIQESVSKRQGNSIFLLSDKDPDDIIRYLVAKRWSDRMRHPEALNMSISILPARHVAALFDQIDAALLIQKNDTSLIRVDNL